MTLARDMSIAPFARFTVTIMGSISGVRPTATATANSSASSQSCLVKPLIKKTVGTMTIMNRIINQIKRLMPWSKAVGTRRPAISSASCPKNVCAPVRTTMPVAKPLTTLAPMKHMFGKSNGFLDPLLVWMAKFFSRHGFASQGGLVDEQVLCLEQAQIGRNHVAGRQFDDVAWDQRFDRDLREFAVSGGRPPPRWIDAPERKQCRLRAAPSAR